MGRSDHAVVGVPWFFQTGHVFTFDWDPLTDRVERSKSCGAILGLVGGAALVGTGQGYFQRIHSDDRERFIGVVHALTPESPGYSTEYRVVRDDGSEVVLEERGVGRFDATGKLERIFGVAADVSERKRMETALRRSETRFRLLHESLRDGFVEVTMSGQIIDCNDVYCAMLGHTVDELRTMTYEQITPERWHDAEAAIVREQIIARGYSEVYEKEYRRKDGSLFPVELRTILARDERGEPVAMWAIVRDITARKSAEEALRRQQRRAEEEARINEVLIESLPGLFYLVDAEGRLLRHNRGLESITGCTASVLATHTLGDHIAIEDRPRASDLLARALREGAANADLEFVACDGRRLFADVAARRVEIEGAPCLVVTGTDITARKTELDRSEARYRDLVESLGDVVFEATADGVITFANAASESVLGYSAERMRGLSIEAHVHPDDVERARGSVRDALDGRATPVEFRIKHRDGTWRQVSLTVRRAPESARASERPHLFGTMKDITELHSKSEQLLQAQRLESVGRLAGGVAHDFNNLLSVIISSADLVLGALGETSQAYDDVVEIRRAGRRAAALTRQLLAFSRKQLLEPQVLDLNKSVSDVRKMLGRLLGEDVEIVLRLGEGVGNVLADRGQLEQVIVNLCVNARDAMPRGGRLNIKTERREVERADGARGEGIAGGSHVVLSIADTGCGMSPETVEHIFEPFFTTKEKSKGTGLGLSTVYGIVKQSGGDINVTSEPGRGTTFEIYLPRVDAPAALIAPKVAARANTGHETVLLVEDDESVRYLAERILSGAGYTVLCAADGTDALLQCQRHRTIDLLLTDVVMPRLSGPELARSLAANRPSLGVLYMSGYNDDALAHHGAVEQSARFIAKPFSASELTLKVREALDAR